MKNNPIFSVGAAHVLLYRLHQKSYIRIQYFDQCSFNRFSNNCLWDVTLEWTLLSVEQQRCPKIPCVRLCFRKVIEDYSIVGVCIFQNFHELNLLQLRFAGESPPASVQVCNAVEISAYEELALREVQSQVWGKPCC